MHLKITVTTETKKESVREKKAGEYAVAVSVAPERGLANARALKLLRAHLGPSKRVIRIVSGHHSPHKTVLVEESV
ncbi:MAG: DUF167 domain-containing protein [Candidatus Paceibacterota bacterium]|jgi:uncharacterized protein YggU (UPF0235/DUF167 family)